MLNYFGNGSKIKQSDKDLIYTKCPNCDESEYIGFGSGGIDGKRKCRCVECGCVYNRSIFREDM